MADSRPTIFADGVVEAQVAHGVARITLAMTGADGKAQPCGMLCVPVTQLPSLVNGMGNLLKQIEERVRAQVAQQQQAPAAAPEAAPAPIRAANDERFNTVGSFRRRSGGASGRGRDAWFHASCRASSG